MAKKDTSKMSNEMEELRSLTEDMSKKYGEGSVITGNSIINTPRRKTGSITLDIITGGGWGKGRIHEVYGPESSGKSTLCVSSMVEAQREGEIAAMIDAEHAFDKEYAEKIGLDVSKIVFSQPDNGEQALDIAIHLINSGKIGLLIIDSVAALTPQQEIEGEMGDSQMGLQARMMGKGLRKMTAAASKSGTTVIFTNQLRDKIGTVYGNPETTTGGKALKFFASIRIDMRATKGNEAEGRRLDSRVTCKTVKNKLASPFQRCEFDINYGTGIDTIMEILELSIAAKIVKVSGSWLSYGETRLGQGRNNVKALLQDNPELLEELELQVREAYQA